MFSWICCAASCHQCHILAADFVEQRLAFDEADGFIDRHLTEAGSLQPDGTGNMRCQEDVRQLVKRRGGLRNFRVGDVDDRVDMAGFQHGDQGRFIDQCAACRIDERRPVLH